ncbi:MAG TPA: HAD-IC family P-type ATPase, partial [Gemmatimonadales bacterium]
RSVMVLLLLLAGTVALVSGDLLDAVAIGAVLALNVAIGFVTELKAHRAVEALLALEVTRARVVREGHVRELDAKELVPGDLIEIEAGQMVPADARLLQAAELRTVEASLTGEPAPADKQADARLDDETPLADRATMLYKATSVVAGHGRAVVVATGMATEVGRIGELVSTVTQEPTPLERRLDSLGRRLVAVALGTAALVVWVGLRQGIRAEEILQTALALAVAAVPEGLPVVGTIVMAVGVRRMARRRALVRHLPVVETLGSATVICTDKTGTLTAGEMTVTVIRLDDREITVTGAGFAPYGDFIDQDARIDPLADPRLRDALRICALTSRGDVAERNEVWAAVGDPTEAAMTVLARKAGLDRDTLLIEAPEVGEVPFSSERMLMATFHRDPGGIAILVKGAPRRILQRCTRGLTAGGPRDLDEEERRRLLELNSELAGRGLRVLALALKHIAHHGNREIQDLTWVGFTGMTDPPAPGVKETIAGFRRAGIRTVMLTGDQRLTAERVASDLGLRDVGEEILEGSEIDRLPDDALRVAIDRAAGYSRVSPEAKLRIIAAYQARGEIVAMLGDGVNDAAALRKADIGVAMGGRGTDMAKEASDLILQDDQFPTIAVAVEEGRVIFDNIRKVVFYLFSCNLAEILVLLGAGLAGLAPPLLPLQILWLNLLTDTVPALALAVEPAEPGIMGQPPRDPREAILSARLTRSIVGYALLIGLCSLGAYGWGLAHDPDDLTRARTLAFMTLALAQIFHLGNARSALPVLAPVRALANRYALAAVGVTAALQVLVLEVDPLARMLRLTPIGLDGWLIVVGLGLVPAVVGQLIKWMAARRSRVSPTPVAV